MSAGGRLGCGGARRLSVISSQGKGAGLKFIFSKKATKIDEIFTVDLRFTT